MIDAQVQRARNAVYIAFIGAGFAFASWASRIPQVRAQLHVSPGVLGLILLCAALGSAVAIPLAGLAIVRFGEAVTVTITSLIAVAGLAVIAIGHRYGIVPVAAGLFGLGFGTGSWDVAMNVQGAAVERAIGRAIMPKFHAGWSIGTVAGAGLGTAMVALHVSVTVHLLAVAAAVALVVPAATRSFLPAGAHAPAAPSSPAAAPAPARRHPLAAWTDWLSLGVIDGYHTPAAVGTATLAGFLAAMTAGRWFGPRFIDRYGRVPALRACAAVALGGLLLVGFGGYLAVAMAGAVLMGLGTSLGFPVGMSAAADDPRYAAGRVSVTSSVGYGAFLAGPPVIGFIADHVGVLHALTVTGVLLVIALFASSATAPLSPVPDRDRDPVA
jgi:MFS family permease